MVGKTSKRPTSTKTSTRRALKAHAHKTSSSSSKLPSPLQTVVQQIQQTTKSAFTPANASAIGWASLIGLDQSDLNRASTSNFSSFPSVHRNAMATPQPFQSKVPTKIMTSIRGIPLYSHGTSAQPSLINQNATTTPDHPFLRQKLDPAQRFIPWPHPSSSSTMANPMQQSPAPPSNPRTSPQPHPQPFTPSATHWRALRDVAFIKDGNLDLTPHALCALLSYRYASTDPQMQAVTVENVEAMWDFVTEGRREGREGLKELYEMEGRKLIRGEMGRDLRRLREGGGVGGGIFRGGGF